MGVFNTNPFLRWLMNDVFQLMVMGFLPPLQKNAGVGFLLQNADHRTGGSFGVRHIRETASEMGQAPALLIRP